MSPGDTKSVTAPDGTIHIFPGDATPDEMNKALTIGSLKSAPVPSSYNFDPALSGTLDAIRPFVAGTAGAAAGTLAAPIPGLSIPADAAAYSGVDYLLKQLKPISQTPASKQAQGDEVTDSVKDGLINAVGGRIINSIFKGAIALRNANLPEVYKFAPTTSQALEAMGHHYLATGAKFAEDFGATGAKAEALDRAGGAGFTQALTYANALNGRMASTNIDPVKLADKLRETLSNNVTMGTPYSNKVFGNEASQASQEALDILSGGKNPFAKVDAVIQDPDKLGKVLRAGQLSGPSGLNVRRDLQAYQFMRMINDGTTKDAMGNIRLDPNKIADAWNDPNLKMSFDTLYGKQGREDVSDFIKNIAYTQDKQTSYPVAKQLRFLGGGFSLGASLLKDALTGDFHTSLGAAGGIASIYLPTAVIGNLLTKQSTAKIVGKLASGAPLDASTAYIGRSLVGALQGLNIALIDAKGNKQWGTIDKDDNSDNFIFKPHK